MLTVPSPPQIIRTVTRGARRLRRPAHAAWTAVRSIRVPGRPGSGKRARPELPARPWGALLAPWVPLAILSTFQYLWQIGAAPSGAGWWPGIHAWSHFNTLLLILQAACVVWWLAVLVPWRRRRLTPIGVVVQPHQTSSAVRKSRTARLHEAPAGVEVPVEAVLRVLRLVVGTARHLNREQRDKLAQAYDAARTGKPWKRALRTAEQAFTDNPRGRYAKLTDVLDELATLHPAAHAAGLAAAAEDLISEQEYETLTGPWSAARLGFAGADLDGSVLIGPLAHGHLNRGHTVPANAPAPGQVVQTFLTWLAIARGLTEGQRAELAKLHIEGSDPAYQRGHEVAWTRACHFGRAQAVRFLELGLPKPLAFVGTAVLTQDLIPDPVYLRLTAGWAAAGHQLPSPFYASEPRMVGVVYEDAPWCCACSDANVPPDSDWTRLTVVDVANAACPGRCTMCERRLIGLVALPARASSAG